MRRSVIYTIVLVFVMSFFSSCTSLLYTTLDVLHPAKVAFNPKTNDILLVNNTVVQPEDYGHKVQLVNEKLHTRKIPTDSLPLFCLSALNEELINKEFFNTVSLQLNSVNQGHDYFTVTPLTEKQVNNLCHEYNSNVVLSLDRLKAIDEVSESYDDYNASFYDYYEVRYEGIWSIHYPGEKDYVTKTFRDTIYWDSQSRYRKRALEELPNAMDALIDGAMYAGRSTANKIIPQWGKADRYFITNGQKVLKEGIDSVYTKNWDAAISIWEKAMEKSTNNLKYKLANNISVCYEITGNLDKAIGYAEIALNLYSSNALMEQNRLTLLTNHLDQLKKREKEVKLLNKQLGE